MQQHTHQTICPPTHAEPDKFYSNCLAFKVADPVGGSLLFFDFETFITGVLFTWLAYPILVLRSCSTVSLSSRLIIVLFLCSFVRLSFQNTITFIPFVLRLCKNIWDKHIFVCFCLSPYTQPTSQLKSRLTQSCPQQTHKEEEEYSSCRLLLLSSWAVSNFRHCQCL